MRRRPVIVALDDVLLRLLDQIDEFLEDLNFSDDWPDWQERRDHILMDIIEFRRRFNREQAVRFGNVPREDD